MGLGKEGKVESRLMGFGVSCRERAGTGTRSPDTSGAAWSWEPRNDLQERVRTGTGPHAIGGVSEVMQRSGTLEKAEGEARRLGYHHTLRATTRVIPHS